MAARNIVQMFPLPEQFLIKSVLNIRDTNTAAEKSPGYIYIYIQNL
jgi:hypothetical protein